jgi:drug/metabolite transporter (DMT)-like permease
VPRLPGFLTSPYLLLILTVTFWAGNSTVARGFVGEVPPLALSFWRWLIALCVILPFGLAPLWRGRDVLFRHWRVMLPLSLFSVASFNTLLYLGLQETTVINASLVGAAMPVTIVAIAWLWFRDRVDFRQGLGIAASLLGVVTIVARGDPTSLAGLHFNEGDLIVLAAIVSWSIYSVMLRKSPKGVEPLGFLTALILLGLVFIAPFYGWELANGRTMAVNGPNLAALAYVGVFPSVLAYVFWNAAVHKVGPAVAGQFMYLTPAIGAGMGMAFLGERLFPFHVVGIVMIFLGIWLATARRPRRR